MSNNLFALPLSESAILVNEEVSKDTVVLRR